jgi:NAD(P)-dependent dehydrogenase (short-subunit alcohol dehydrogenase family)
MTDNLFSLDGRVVVITGAAGLMGRQHTEVVAHAGGIPVLLDIQDAPVQELADQTSKRFGVPASGWGVDITCEAEVAQNCASVLARYGRIDGLINNAANNPKVEDEAGQNFSRLENFPPAEFTTGSFVNDEGG